MSASCNTQDNAGWWCIVQGAVNHAGAHVFRRPRWWRAGP